MSGKELVLGQAENGIIVEIHLYASIAYQTFFAISNYMSMHCLLLYKYLHFSGIYKPFYSNVDFFLLASNHSDTW